MKKLAMLLACFVLAGTQFLWAQGTVITGTVTGKEDGQPIPGVAVLVKGTTIGTITDFDGKYSLSVPQNAVSLVFSFVGMKTVEVPIEGKTTIDVAMESDVLGISEVVVTALGITKEKKSIGYAIQDVSGDEISRAGERNMVNALQGKVAGVFINNSSGSIASSSRIVIRGNNSLTRENQPLFVVDGVPISNTYNTTGGYGGVDYGNAAMDINPSDIESVTVLKGGNAAALYGQRGANGVIMITTKSGKSRKGLGVTFENSFAWDNVLILPDFQNEYGQGYYGEFEYVDGAGSGINDNVDESWGPKLDGRLIPQYDSPYDPVTGIRTPTPWVAHPDNIKSLFQTGTSRNTSLALEGSNEKANFRLSMTNNDAIGVVPNTDLKKNSFYLTGGYKLSEKLQVSATANYLRNNSANIPSGGYTSANILQQSSWHGRQVDYAGLKKMINVIDPVTGLPFNWNHSYHDNPWWTMYKNTNSRDRQRIIGNVNIQYFFTDWLNFQAQVGTDYFSEVRNERRAKGSHDWPDGQYNSWSRIFNETNASAMLTFNRNIIADLNLTATIGANIMHRDDRQQNTFIAQLIIPDLYATSNAVVPPATWLSESHQEIQSVYGLINLNYKGWLSLEGTLRDDWASTLPVKKNPYSYPSFNAGFVFTDALGIQSNLFSYGKLRGGWAKVASPADPYSLTGVYTSSDPFEGNPVMNYTNTLPNINLDPETTVSKEVGAELKFFNSRVVFDVTLFQKNTTNQILPISISSATGFTSKWINAGEMQNKGIELLVNLTPVKLRKFTWDVDINYTRIKNEVLSLAPDMSFFALGGAWSIQIQARPGEPYGSMFYRTIARENYKADTQKGVVLTNTGRPLVSPFTGNYVRTSYNTVIGNITPDWLGSLRNSFMFDKFNLSVLIDVRKGGDLFSVTNFFGEYAGTLASTVGKNPKGNDIRTPVADGGGYLVKGVLGKIKPDGTVEYLDANGNHSDVPIENTEVYIEAQDYFEGIWGYQGGRSIFDGSYVKLREVSAGYTFDQPFLQKIGIRNLNLSLVGRNLAILHKNVPNIDPENAFDAGNVQGLESNMLPSVRTISVNLKVVF